MAVSITCTKWRRLICSLMIALPSVVWSQDTVKIEVYRMASVDTLHALNAQPRITDTNAIVCWPLGRNYKSRQKTVAFTSIGVYSATLLALNQAWYANYPRSSFHFFDDNAEWLQVDKVGHSWSAYQLSRLTYSAWKWSGISEKKAVLYAGLSGPGFLTVVELLDGFSKEWGWSWGDIGANVFGGGLFVAQQLGWHEQRIDYKFSFHHKNYSDPGLQQRANHLFGKSLPESALKDYNSQTYWLSANLHAFFKKSTIPKWLNIAIGYGANGMFGAMKNVGQANDGSMIFDRRDIPRYRQWYLSPDIKWSKIKTHSKLLKTVFYVLDGIKFPLPGLELSQGKIKARAILF